MPWVYTRRVIAQAWHCRPWEVDEAPIDEIMTELAIMRIESQAQDSWRQRDRHR